MSKVVNNLLAVATVTRQSYSEVNQLLQDSAVQCFVKQTMYRPPHVGRYMGTEYYVYMQKDAEDVLRITV